MEIGVAAAEEIVALVAAETVAFVAEVEEVAVAVEVEVAAAAALGIGQSGSDARVLVRAAADARPDQNLAPKHIAPDGCYLS